MTYQEMHKLLITGFKAGIRAAESINEFYRLQTTVDYKTDGTPVTEADFSAHEIIIRHLSSTGIPILSEESEDHSWQLRKHWDWFWLIDPLDGTKEYIDRNGEFTVNIALIHNSIPVMGIIVAPALNTAYWGVTGKNAWKVFHNDLLKKNNAEWLEQHIINSSEALKDLKPCDELRVMGSRSHKDEKTSELFNQLKRKMSNARFSARGSSLKFCQLAEKQATLYPRYSPTFEWDTAAGHAILKAAGGEVYDINTKKPLQYNKPDLVNPAFFAFADKTDSDRYFREFSL